MNIVRNEKDDTIWFASDTREGWGFGTLCGVSVTKKEIVDAVIAGMTAQGEEFEKLAQDFGHKDLSRHRRAIQESSRRWNAVCDKAGVKDS